MSFIYDVTRLAGKAVEEIVSAPEQIMEGVLDSIDEALEGK